MHYRIRYQLVQGSLSGYGCLGILGVSPVKTGGCRRPTVHMYAYMRFAVVVFLMLECSGTTRVVKKVKRNVWLESDRICPEWDTRA